MARRAPRARRRGGDRHRRRRRRNLGFHYLVGIAREQGGRGPGPGPRARPAAHRRRGESAGGRKDLPQPCRAGQGRARCPRAGAQGMAADQGGRDGAVAGRLPEAARRRCRRCPVRPGGVLEVRRQRAPLARFRHRGARIRVRGPGKARGGEEGVRPSRRRGHAAAGRLPRGPAGAAREQARRQAAAREGGEGISQGPRRAGGEPADRDRLAAALHAVGRAAQVRREAEARPESQGSAEEVMLLAILLSFAWTPLSHRPAQPAAPVLSDRAFFVGEMVYLVPRDRLAFRPRETATPVLDESGSRLYVGTSDGFVRCRFHGEPSWSWKAGGSILAAPLLIEETLYVPGADGKLTALNRITGEVRWEADVHEEFTTTPVFADDKLFVLSSEESIAAVVLKTGNLVWKFHRDPPPGFTLRGNARPQVAHT